MAHAEHLEPPDQCFSLSLDLFGEAGRDGYFQRLDPAFTRAFGYTETELLAAPFVTFVHLEDRAATRAELDKLGRGEPALGFENRFRRRDGAYRWLAWTAVPTPEGLVYAAARDITARRLADGRADAAATRGHTHDDFLVSVSHDLQQPLALIWARCSSFNASWRVATDRRGRSRSKPSAT
jgi:PAS domain S-box-containing protein